MDWTKEHEQELELYIDDGLTYAQIAELLNEEFGTARTAVAVSMKCFKLGLKSKSRKHTTEQYKAEIPNKDIELLGEYEGAHTPIKHKCLICTNEWKARPSSIKQGKGCPVCANKVRQHTTEQYKAEIPDGIELLEEYEGALTLIKHKCLVCTNEWKASPSSIKQGSGCPPCSNKHTTEQYKLDIPNEDIELLEEYIDNKTPILHRHSCGHEWLASPNSIKKGTGCPVCANKRHPGYYGSLTKEQADALGYPLYLYNVKLHHGNETFYKIGLTKNKDRSRFKKYKPYKVVEELSFDELDAWTAIRKEEELKLKCNYKPKHEFGGHNECYQK